MAQYLSQYNNYNKNINTAQTLVRGDYSKRVHAHTYTAGTRVHEYIDYTQLTSFAAIEHVAEQGLEAGEDSRR